MNAIGVLLLAAATATSSDELGKPHVGMKRLFRPHAVMHGPPPPSGPVNMANMGGPGGPGGPGVAGDVAGANAGRRFPNVRSQIFFVDPPGMQVGWQTASDSGDRVYLPAQLIVPARYNFTQGYIYRLKVTNIPNRPGLSLYPTIEVAPSTPATDAYLTHNPIPVQFTEEDFDQVQAGNFVTKVIYLPDPKYQELAVAGVETLVSTRLEPGVDPILEADRRGTILLIVRLGGIDLEMPTSGVGVGGTLGGPVLGSGFGDGIPSGPPITPIFSPTGSILPNTSVDLPPGAPVNPSAVPLGTFPTGGQVVPPAPVPPGDGAPATAAAPTGVLAPAPAEPAGADLGSEPANDTPVAPAPGVPDF